MPKRTPIGIASKLLNKPIKVVGKPFCNLMPRQQTKEAHLENSDSLLRNRQHDLFS